MVSLNKPIFYLLLVFVLSSCAFEKVPPIFPPTANFEMKCQTSDCFNGKTIQFSDASTNVSSWLWDLWG